MTLGNMRELGMHQMISGGLNLFGNMCWTSHRRKR